MEVRFFSLLIVLLVAVGPIFAQSRYYRTETHCHSNNSGDGYVTPANLLQQYKSRFYDIVFLSDHDTLTDAEALDVPGIKGINAIELSCGSHFNGFDMKRSVVGCGLGNQRKVDSILAQDALVCVNHPIAKNWRITAQEILALNGEISFVEIYNPTDIYDAPDDQSLWDSLLTAGRKIWGLASGDVHFFYPLENLWLGWNMIKLDTLSKAAVLEAMLRGDMYASTGVDISDYRVNGDTVSVSCSNCVRIIFWGQNHTKLKQVNQASATYIRQPGDAYVRAELIFDRYNKAWTQPVFYNIIPTGFPLEDRTAIENLKVFPNPAQEKITVEYTLLKDQRINIDLFNLQGQLIKNLTQENQQRGQQRFFLDISNIPNGAYMIRVSGEHFFRTQAAVVLH